MFLKRTTVRTLSTDDLIHVAAAKYGNVTRAPNNPAAGLGCLYVGETSYPRAH